MGDTEAAVGVMLRVLRGQWRGHCRAGSRAAVVHPGGGDTRGELLVARRGSGLAPTHGAQGLGGLASAGRGPSARATTYPHCPAPPAPAATTTTTGGVAAGGAQEEEEEEEAGGGRRQRSGGACPA